MNSNAATEENPTSITYIIQYDGLKIGDNTISLADLGESLQGFSKILLSVGHLATTGQYSRKYSGMNVEVTTTAQLEAGCIEIPVQISNIMPELFSGLAGSIVTAIVSYIISKRGKEEMEHLSQALQQSLSQNKELQDRLLGTIDKMADGLIAANRQALSPIGRSCTTISVCDSDKKEFLKADASTKEFFAKPVDNKITPEKNFLVRFTELDLLTGSCKVSLENEDPEERINGQISDPLLSNRDNPYVRAFALGKELQVKGKATLSEDGEITKLFINDAFPD